MTYLLRQKKPMAFRTEGKEKSSHPHSRMRCPHSQTAVCLMGTAAASRLLLVAMPLMAPAAMCDYAQGQRLRPASASIPRVVCWCRVHDKPRLTSKT